MQVNLCMIIVIIKNKGHDYEITCIENLSRLLKSFERSTQ